MGVAKELIAQIVIKSNIFRADILISADKVPTYFKTFLNALQAT